MIGRSRPQLTADVVARPAGELAIVLHTHMPYVEGFGTWPFGEEWLWEAIACVYLPLLGLLDGGWPLTLSLTPVLADQLAVAGLAERFERFLVEVRAETHRRDVAALELAGEDQLAREVQRAGGDYERAWEQITALDGGLPDALAAHASWTSAATHAVLALCATDAGVRLQLASAIKSQRARRGRWHGGFWLPECAYAPWLEPLLWACGVRACCVDLTDHFGVGAASQLEPLRSPIGPTLVPIDRQTIELAWSDGGYPAHACYRDYHRLSAFGNHPWANDGSPYDHALALARARADAEHFVSYARARLESGGLLVCAFDTELFGHWWYEGMHWLEAVLEEARRQGLPIATLDDALARHPPRLIEHGTLPVSSWGTPRDLSTWDCPATAEIVAAAREGEVRLLAAGRTASATAVRELLALQSSDWAFMASRAIAGGYARERVEGHRQALGEALKNNGAAAAAAHRLAPLAGVGPALEP
jgi:1,4-alpha-glucan branching enzyme